jgi:hypothetical protein
MATKYLSPAQSDALRSREPNWDVREKMVRVITGRANTLASLVRLELAEVIEKDGRAFHVLTAAGELIAAPLQYGDRVRLDSVASAIAYVEKEATKVHDGSYEPHAPGARTLRDARPLMINGERVRVLVEGDGARLYLFVGGHTLYSGPIPEGVTKAADVNPWAREEAIGWGKLHAFGETSREADYAVTSYDTNREESVLEWQRGEGSQVSTFYATTWTAMDGALGMYAEEDGTSAEALQEAYNRVDAAGWDHRKRSAQETATEEAELRRAFDNMERTNNGASLVDLMRYAAPLWERVGGLEEAPGELGRIMRAARGERHFDNLVGYARRAVKLWQSIAPGEPVTTR